MDLSKNIGDTIRCAVRTCGNIRNLGSRVEIELRDVLKDVIAFKKFDLDDKCFVCDKFLIFDKVNKDYFVLSYLDLMSHITDNLVYFDHFDVYKLSEE